MSPVSRKAQIDMPAQAKATTHPESARRLAILALMLTVILLMVRGLALGQEAGPAPAAEPAAAAGGAAEPAAMVTVPPYGAHAGLQCSECHADQEAPTAPLSAPAAGCKLCHDDEVTDLGKSSHGKAMLEYFKKTGGSPTLKDICLSCHGEDVHTVRKHDDPEAPAFRGHVVQTCQACHDKLPDYKPDIYLRSVHAAVAEGKTGPAAVCTDCHGNHAINGPEAPGSPVSRQLVDKTCGKCHKDEIFDFENSIHFNALEQNDPDVPTCTRCHGAHDVLPPSDPTSKTNRLQADLICMGCHTDPGVAKRHPNLPPPEFIKNYTQSVHGRGVHVLGLLVSATCIDCHATHRIRPKNDPTSTVYRENVPNTCEKCHLGIFDTFVNSSHGKLWEEKDKKGPVCTTCHSSHSIQAPALQLFTIFKIDTECGGCHLKSEQTYSNTFHGKTTSMGFFAAAKCSDCHTAHDNLPPNDPDSTVNPAHLQETCGHCHGKVSANFIKYDPHPDPEDKKKSALLYYTNIFMKLLIFGVFGFFGAHTLLWLQRSIVAFMRGEKYATLHLDSQKHVRRWSTSAVVMHIVIVTSFLGLVATGLPLRYHFTEWAQVLGSIYGGVEVSRLIHRFCAFVTIGYALFHVGTLIKRILIKKEYHLFYGPDTMVPRWKDLVDLYHNFKFFFYLGPPPRWGKWTYYEKFDYFALFWGVPIVVITGLVMLFPNFFSRFMPGSWLNVASLVHSEEALLAAGFIFTFHFFHNHLRPGVIPMDINIFTGTMPLPRLIQERPEEYERLKSGGLLDQLVVDAPNSRIMLESKLFGLAALSIGLFLIVAIFVSYVLSH
ncbi:MAG TPA: cytochrome c3 family protein [bacterium]|nr:cytochrome c3 family protein [bacterium]